MKAMAALSTKRIEPLFRWSVILSTCSILVGAYFAGIARGLDSFIGTAQVGPFLLGVCATATRWLTGIGDYACLQSIFSGDTGLMHDLGLRVQYDHLFHREFIDNALQQLFSHPHWTVPPTTFGPPYVGIGGIGWGMDEGYATFVDLAFHLFGPRLEAFYRTYWLIVGVAAAAYVIAYRRALAPLLVLLVFAVVQYMIFSTSLLWDFGGPVTDPGSPRFLSSLCIIPVLHLIAAARSDAPWRWRDLGPIAVQGFVLGLALLQRTTVDWVILAFVLLAAVYWWWRRRFAPTTAKRRYWSVAVVALAIGLMTHLYSDVVRHRAATAHGDVPGHNVWFTVFETLYYNPNWNARYGAEYNNLTYDEMVQFACRRYLARHKEEWPRWNPSNGDPYTIPMASVGIEQLCRKAFFEFFRNDPKFVLATWLVYNTQRAIVLGADMAAQYLQWLWGIPSLFLIGVGAIAGLISRRSVARLALGYVPLTLYFTTMAVAPNWLTVLNTNTMTDYFVMLAITTGTAILAVGIVVGIIMRDALPIGTATALAPANIGPAASDSL